MNRFTKATLSWVLVVSIYGCPQASVDLSTAARPVQDSRPTRLEVDRVIGVHPLLVERSLCEVFERATFGGVYEVERLVTDELPDPVTGKQRYPFTEARFLRIDASFASSGAPSEFQLLMRGGPRPDGRTMTTDLSLTVGERYVVFPVQEPDGSISLSPNAIFSERRSDGGFANDYLLNEGPPVDESSLGDLHRKFLSAGCASDIPADAAIIRHRGASRPASVPVETEEVAFESP